MSGEVLSCPECGRMVRKAANEAEAICPGCDHVWRPVQAPPVQRSAWPAGTPVSIEAARLASEVEERGAQKIAEAPRREEIVKEEKEPEESPATIICFVLGFFFFILYVPLMLCAYLIARTQKWKRLSAIALIVPLLFTAGLVLWIAMASAFSLRW